MENTCKVVIVSPGDPDSVIRIRPADHKDEKIWLDTQPGRERWKGIQALMQRFCPRGKYVPEPAYYHPRTGKQEDIQTLLIHTDEDIPLAELDGAVLSAPPAKERAPMAEKSALQKSSDQVTVLTEQVSKLTSAVASILEANASRPRAGRPRKEE